MRVNLNKIYSRVQRRTTSAFELATSVLFLSGIQHYAESAEGMNQMPPFVKTFLQTLPDHWDEVKFIDGFPGKLVVIARRSGNKWYVAGINGDTVEKNLMLNLAWLKPKKGSLIRSGNQQLSLEKQPVALNAEGTASLNLATNDGFVMVFE